MSTSSSPRRERLSTPVTAPPRPDAAGQLPLPPGVLLGVGVGGFVDGTLLHQLLQLHHMRTATDRYRASTIAGLQASTVADGLFHAAAWVQVFVGARLVIKDWQHGRIAPPWRTSVGALLADWGGFNAIEGLVDHHVLQVHHVRDDVSTPPPWDLGFLAVGVALLVIGIALISSGRPIRSTSRRAA